MNAVENSWGDRLNALAPTPSYNMKKWLQKKQHISAHLRRYEPNLQLTLLHAGISACHLHEVDTLQLDDNQAYVRFVSIGNHSQVLIYARTVLPKATYQVFQDELDNLGTRFIGETLLYKDTTIERSDFDYTCSRVPGVDMPESFCRRSKFSIGAHQLLLTEWFLPTMDAYPC